jgi:hypothetical protein
MGWRNTAISLPALWATIRIDSDTPNISLGMLKVLIERSGSSPLAIIFKSTDIEAFKLILDHSERWHTITLSLREWMIPLLDMATGNLLLLRSLTYDGEFSSFCNAFETAPRLDQVTVDVRHAMPIPYRQLLRLRQHVPQTLPTAAGLRLAHNLTGLSLFGVQPSQDMGSPIELPRLQMMYIVDGSYLDSLVLPALEDIFIHSNSSSLVSLIRRSSCALRKLGAMDRDIFALLEHVPTLYELVCQDPDMKIVSCLAVPLHADPSCSLLCPELRSLTILFDSSQDSTGSRMTPLMESRHRTALCPPLSVRLYEGHPRQLTPHALERHATLRQRGMDIQWFPIARWHTHIDSIYDTYP